MSAAQNSNLSQIGYDLVVATTQKALNATMLEYLDASADKVQPVVVCYKWKQEVDPVTKKKSSHLSLISLEDMMKLANSSKSPFDISSDADPDSDVDLQRLRFAGFACAMSITPGLPHGIDPTQFPNIIELGSQSSSVKYNMLTSDVKIAAMVYAGMSVSWVSYCQPAGSYLEISCSVDLRMSKDHSSDAFQKLPPAVQQAIWHSFQGEDAFSVQQLLFDLDNAGLQTVPTSVIFGAASDLDPSITATINGSFLSSYFNDMKTRGQPLLHVAVVSTKQDTSAFRATDVEMEVCRMLGVNGKPAEKPTSAEQDLSTLNYLCMTKDQPMPTVQQPNWNWLTESESRQYDGVISVSRKAFIQYLKDQLNSQVQDFCYFPRVKCWLNSGSIPQYACAFKNLSGNKEINPWNRDDFHNALNDGRTGKLDFHTTDPGNPIIMEWDWHSDRDHDTAGSPVTLGYITLQCSYNCQVKLEGNQITVTQHLLFWMDVMKSQDSNSGNIVDQTITETIDLKVDEHGKVVPSTPVATKEDHSQTPGSNGFMNAFNHINDEVAVIQQAANVAASGFKAPDIAAVQGFQFPGGKTFAFRGFQFSRFQDLTAAITYVQ